MLLGQYVLSKVQFAEREDGEELCDGVSRELIVVKVDVFELGSLLDGFHQHLSSLVVYFVIRKVQLLQRVTFSDKLSDLFGAY